MTVVFPDGVRSRGNESLIFTTVLVPTAPSVATLNAVTAVNVSCYVTNFAPTGSQESSEDPRLCSEQIFESPGDIAVAIDNVEYIYYPQATVPTANNKAYELMKNGVSGWMVDRRGLNARTAALAVGQLVDIYPVTLGEQFRMPLDPGQQGGKFRITQKPFVTGPYAYDVALVA